MQMGIMSSRRENVQPEVVEQPKIDKDELLAEMKQYIDERVSESQEANRELEVKSEHYKLEYEKLYQKHEALIQEMEMKNTKSKISEKAIDAFVQTMMDDPKTNIRGFPDAIESALYKKALKTIMYAVAHTADVTSLRFMGHKISITIEPEETVETKTVEQHH
jgi:hypothetical protein